MQIRHADVEDSQLLAELNATVQRLHAENRPDIFKPPVLSDELVAWFETLLRESDSHIFIGELESEAVGYIVTKIIRRPDNPFTYAANVLYIDQISINTEHQGKGYGKRLLLAAYNLARSENINRIELGVLDFNIHAIEFYKRQGFRIYSERMAFELG
jgi:ribosomal protein S18 acetylase RimI-like enzyme